MWRHVPGDGPPQQWRSVMAMAVGGGPVDAAVLGVELLAGVDHVRVAGGAAEQLGVVAWVHLSRGRVAGFAQGSQVRVSVGRARKQERG
jgi:hypothetical protein